MPVGASVFLAAAFFGLLGAFVFLIVSAINVLQHNLAINKFLPITSRIPDSIPPRTSRDPARTMKVYLARAPDTRQQLVSPRTRYRIVAVHRTMEASALPEFQPYISPAD